MLSEVQQLRERIELEIESMHQGLTGLAVIAKHQFIEARYNRLQRFTQRLTSKAQQ